MKSQVPLSLAHFSAFSCSHTQIFYGLNNGTIYIEPYPNCRYSNSFSINISNYLNRLPYSVVWTKESLWAFTENSCISIDLNTLSITHTKIPFTNVFPVFSDGQYFYSMANSNRFVTVFTIKHNKITLLKKVKLEKSIERIVPFTTNGLFITFADIENSHRVFKQFSLVNGAFIRQFKADFQDTEFAFCNSPYRQHHVVLTNTNLLFLIGNFQLPRWAISLPFPDNHLSDLFTNFDSLYYALYHDKEMFYTVRFESVKEMANEYIQTQNGWGMYLVGMLLCRCVDRKPTTLLDNYFLNTKGRIRSFICFVYLLCLSTNKTPGEETIRLPNIINTFLEENYPPVFIWLFPKYFNMSRIQFSAKAIMKLITYVLSNTVSFPAESMYILSSFLKLAFSNIENDIDKYTAPLNAITISIEQKVMMLARKQGLSDNFVNNSVDCKIWKDMLMLIYQNRKNWFYLSSSFSKFFGFSLLNSELYCGELTCLLNCSLYICLSLFSNLSFALNPPFYHSIEDFFKDYRHPMNGVYFTVDQKVFSLLSKCNDIPSQEEFSKYFFQFRNFFIFEAPSLPFRTFNPMMSTPSQNLDDLLTNHQDEQWSIRGVIKFIFENNKHELIQLQSHSIIAWLLNLIETNELNEYQQCIFSIFLPMFEKFKTVFCQYLNTNNPGENFIEKFIYPFLFPHEIILSLPNFTCSIDQIIQYPYDLLNFSYKNIMKCYNKITDSTQIMLPFIDRLTKNDEIKPTALFNPDSEKQLLHDSLLWLIGFKCGELIDFRHHTPTFVFLLRNTSRVNVRVAMRWIYTAEEIHDINVDSLFFEMLDIIAEYLYDMKNPLHTIKEPFEVADTVFTINHYCRKLFNLQSNIFRNAIMKYLFGKPVDDLKSDELTFDKKKWLAVFSILNNSIDLLRKHSQLTVLDEDFISISGKIRDYTILRSRSNVINSVIIEKNDESREKIRLNKCIQLWTTPRFVNLSLLLKDNPNYSQIFQTVFDKIDYEFDYQNTFTLASLNAFLKLDGFRNCLTPEFIKKNIEIDRDNWPNYYMMDDSFLNFSYFLTISHLHLENNSFIFSSYEDDLLLNRNIDDITDDYIPLNMKSTFSGKQELITLDKEIAFKSLPLHSHLHSRISMKSVPSISFSIEIFGLSDKNNSILKSGPIIYYPVDSYEEVELFTFEVIPQKSLISINVHREVDPIHISMPPLTMLYVILRIGENAISVVDYQIDPDIIDLEITKEDDQSHRMILIENDTIKEKSELPSNDSKAFNFTSLELSARNLNNTLRQLNAISFPNMELPPSALINFLFYTNPLFSDKSLNFDEMLSIPLWLTEASELRKIVLGQITTQKLAEIEHEIYRRKTNWQGVDIQTNRSYIVSRNASSSELSKKKFMNCYIIADDTYQIIGIQKTEVDLTDKMIILPYLHVQGTSLQIAIHFRHLIALYRYQKVEHFNISAFLEITKLTRKGDSKIFETTSYFSTASDQFKPIFENILSMIELIFPDIPDKSEKPIFLEDSLFLKESIVHDYPNIFFFHKYFELTSPRYRNQPFTCTKYPMYFTPVNRDITFSINKKSFQKNQFAILYDQFEQIPHSSQGISIKKSFSVQCNDPNCIFIFDVVPEFHKIDEEFRLWEPHHSIQLLLSMMSTDNLKETYPKLPLSKQFCFKTVNFIYQLVKKHQKRMNEYVNDFDNRINIVPMNGHQRNKMKLSANNEYFNIRSKPNNNIQLSELSKNSQLTSSDPSLNIDHRNSMMPKNEIVGPVVDQNDKNAHQSYIQYIPPSMPNSLDNKPISDSISSAHSFVYYGNNTNMRQSYQGHDVIQYQKPRDISNNSTKMSLNEYVKPTKQNKVNQTNTNRATQQNNQSNNSIKQSISNQSNNLNQNSNQENNLTPNKLNRPGIIVNELTDIEKSKTDHKNKKVTISPSPIIGEESSMNSHKGDNFKFVRKLSSSFQFSREISQFSVESRERVEFLKGLGVSCTIFEKYDPFMIHVLTSFKSNCKTISYMRRNPSMFIRYQNLSAQAMSYITQFIQISPDFVVSMFIEFCTGEFTITPWPIYAISVNDIQILTVSKEDHLIVIGFFANYDAFASKLLMMMQKAQNTIVHTNIKSW